VDLIDRHGEDDQVFVVALEAGNLYGDSGLLICNVSPVRRRVSRIVI
jgi:hypothetical protein